MEYQAESYLVGPTQRVGFGQISFDPISIGTKVANLATSYAASAGIITSALATGVGAALAVVTVVYSFITANQAKVKAKRRAREAKWEGIYQLGVGLITDVYGSIKDFTWSHAHSSDTGFGEYYWLGAMFWQWTGGTRDPSLTQEDYRRDLVQYIKHLGLEPTRFLGFENVALDEELDPKIDFVHVAEKKATAKEILMGFGYTVDQVNAITDEEPLIWIHDSFEIDLPDLTTPAQAEIFMNDMTLSIGMLNLDPSIFQNKVSDIASKGFEKTMPVLVSEPLTASLSSSGGILIIGMAAAVFLGMKKSRRRK